jgi:hypothetical protein
VGKSLGEFTVDYSLGHVVINDAVFVVGAIDQQCVQILLIIWRTGE